MNIKKIIERLGLDWLGILIGINPKFNNGNNISYKSIEKDFEKLNSKDKIDYGLEQCERMLSDENERLKIIESKAFTLLGITGVATGYIINLAKILMENEVPINNWLLAIIYVMVIFPLIITLLISLKVVIVGKYTFPNIIDAKRFNEDDINSTRKSHFLSTYYSILVNREVNNNKTTYLIGAQIWFRNSIFILMLFALLISGYIGTTLKNSSISINNIPSYATTEITSFEITGTPEQKITRIPVKPAETLIPYEEGTTCEPINTIEP